MTVNFWWVRHGPTHSNKIIGHTDIPADLSNHSALTSLQSYLPDQAKIISSDLIRAKATADAIANTRHQNPPIRALREINFGDWEGRSFDEIAKSDAILAQNYWEFPGDTSPPNGESWNSFSTRIHAEIKRQIVKNPAKNVIAVAHFGVILSALQLAGGFSPKSVFSFKISNLSVTRLQYSIKLGAWTIKCVNQTP